MILIQAVLFDIKKYDEKYAENWLKSHNLHPIKNVHKTEKYLRYRIRDPSIFDKKSFRIKKTSEGISFILGKFSMKNIS